MPVSQQADVELEARSGLPQFTLPLRLNILNKLTGKLKTPAMDPLASYPVLNDGPRIMAEDWPADGPLSIDVLLGQDYMGSHFLGIPTALGEGNRGPLALETPFGTVIQGRAPGAAGSSQEATAATTTVQDTNTRKTAPLAIPRKGPPPCIRAAKVTPLNELLREWINLENIGIKDPEEGIPHAKQLSSVEEYAVKYLEENLEYMEDSKRFRVKLPFDPKQPPLQDNFHAAHARITQLLAGLDRKGQEAKKKLYYDAMQKYLDKKHAERVTSNDESATTIFYLPHSGVLKEASTGKGKKIRIVFDCSARDPKGTSLNETMMVGPVPDADLVRILTRFRMNEVAFGADVSECFLTVQMHPDDQNKFRFLWVDEEGKVVKYKFTSLIFGSKASPWISSTCLFKLLDRHSKSDSNLVEKVKKSIWVDDIVMSEPTVDSARDVIKKLEDIFAEASFRLAKFVSSHDAALDHLPDDQRVFPSGIKEKGSLKVLGIDWQVDKDEIFIGRDFEEAFTTKRTRSGNTKRSLARMVASIYDPLGLLLPWKMGGNILIKEAWSYHDIISQERGISKAAKALWDEKLPVELQRKVDEWAADYKSAAKITLPRWLGIDREAESREIYGFADASPFGFGGVVYLRSKFPNGDIQCRFLLAKGKVNKVNGHTLPRCELLAAKFLSTMVYELKEFMDLADDFPCKLFGDSMVALYWIKGNPANWKVFVSNAVATIRKFSTPEQWYHVPGLENPADLLTRPKSPTEILEHKPWLNGPDFAYTDDIPPQPEFYALTEDAASEFKVKPGEELIGALIIKDRDPHPVGMLMESISDVRKVLRIIVRFKRAARARNLKMLFAKQAITLGDMVAGADELMKHVQRKEFSEELKALRKGENVSSKSRIRDLNPFLDGGLIKARGRIQCINREGEDSWKQPIVISNDGIIIPAVIRFIHEDKDHATTDTIHSLMRTRWWLLRARRVISDVKKDCVVCRKITGRFQSQIQAPLPAARLAVNLPPFANVAIDGLGPLHVVTESGKGKKKVWVLVFSCMTTRALNLELLTDVSADSFVLALRRHFADFGKAHSVRLDNFPSHKKMAEIFNSLDQADSSTSPLTRRGRKAARDIYWSWSAVGQPSTNGVVERAVRSAKESLRKAIGNSLLENETLATLLKEARQIINSRPLVQLPRGSIDDDLAITPNHLIYGRDLTRLPLGDEVIVDKRRKPTLAYWSQKQRCLKRFKELFKEQYINSLMALKKNLKEEPEPLVGDLVLISHPLKKRSAWPTGVIDELHSGVDGLTRNATIRVSGQLVKRSIRSLVVLRHLDNYEPSQPRGDTENEDKISEDPLGTTLETPETMEDVEDAIS